MTAVGTPTCSGLAARLGVDPAGTASAIRSWLLLEHPGPWGEHARERAFAAALGPVGWQRLEQLWMREQLRPLLVRRPGRAGHSADPPTLLLGAAIGGAAWLERLPAADLPSVDLEALAAGEPGHGEPVDGPVFAVCTNGAVDRCCAVRGRPLAAALAAAHPGRTWEVTHLGGCRFAASLLVLPLAVMHGALTPAAGLLVAAAAMAGEVATSGLRGRTGTTSYAGAAEVALRRRLSVREPAAVEVLDELAH
ncbi:MAG TPA: sucrase ferredoxin, partial [Actinomycetales bacterium]